MFAQIRPLDFLKSSPIVNWWPVILSFLFEYFIVKAIKDECLVGLLLDHVETKRIMIPRK